MAAISTLIKKAYWPYARDFYDRRDVWLDKVRDYSAQFAMGGKSLEIDVDTTRYGGYNPAAGEFTPEPATQILEDLSSTISEDSTITQLERGDPTLPTADKVTFTIDKYYEIDIGLGRLMQQRHQQINWRERIQSGDMRAFMYQKNKDIRDVFEAMTGDYVIDKDDVSGLETTAANWGNPAYRQALIDTFKEASLKADDWDWPEEGRRIVMGPENYAEVVQWLQDKNVHFVEATVNDRAYIEGKWNGLWGWQVEKDIDMGRGHSNTDDAKQSMYFLSQRNGIAWGSDLDFFDAFNSEKFRVWRLVHEMTWGVKAYNPRYQFKAAVSIT